MRLSASPPLDAVQRREVPQVLLDGEIEIQRRLLKHHAHGGESLSRVRADIPPAHPDAALAALEQMRDQREKRRLAGAIGPEKRREFAAMDAERDVFEGEPIAVAETEAVDFQGRLGRHQRVRHRTNTNSR